MSGWINNNEIDCPVAPNTDVEVRYHGGHTKYDATPQGLDWSAIEAYRVISHIPAVTEEEDRAWQEKERALMAERKLAGSVAEALGANPADSAPSKYHREIKPGVWVDIYDVLLAYEVTNPGDQHALKKMLAPGKRGVKDARQDRQEAIASIERAIELEAQRHGG